MSIGHRVWIASFGLLSLAAPASTQSVLERQVLTPPGAPNGTGFGSKLERSDTLALVGAPYDAELGTRGGAAYVYARDAQQRWTFARKLTASDGADDDQFGYGLALDGATALVGAFGKDGAGLDEGAVYVFARDQGGAGAWGEVAKLVAPAPAAGSSFGYALAVDGDVLAIGAPRVSAPGSVYLYRRDALAPAGWSFLRELVPLDPSTGFAFGYALALQGDTLLVSGSPQPDFARDYAVHVRVRDEGGADQWGETQRIEPPGGYTFSYFGFRLALAGDTLAIPAWEYVLDRQHFGEIYLYERVGGRFEHVALVHSELAQDGGMPPQSIALGRDWLAVGTLYEPARALEDVGAVLVFARDADGPSTWGEVAKLQPVNPHPEAYFGFALALDEERLLVGAPDDYFLAGAGSGTVHELDLARLARATWRNDAAGHDADVHASETRPVLGAHYRARIDLASAGRTHALLAVFASRDERTLAGGQVQLGRGRIAFVAESSPGLFDAAVPAIPALLGLELVTQAALYGGRPGFELSNALDLRLGVE
jgi:hypothetical protein